jgi:hypothetical protein
VFGGPWRDAAHTRCGGCCLARTSDCRWRHSGRTRPCGSFGARGCWRLENPLPCKPRSRRPSSISRATFAGERDDTVFLENLFDVCWQNAPHRTLRNQTIDVWEAAGCPPTGKRPGEGEMIAKSQSSGPIVRYQSCTPSPDTEGDRCPVAMGRTECWPRVEASVGRRHRSRDCRGSTIGPSAISTLTARGHFETKSEAASSPIYWSGPPK